MRWKQFFILLGGLAAIMLLVRTMMTTNPGEHGAEIVVQTLREMFSYVIGGFVNWWVTKRLTTTGNMGDAKRFVLFFTASVFVCTAIAQALGFL